MPFIYWLVAGSITASSLMLVLCCGYVMLSRFLKPKDKNPPESFEILVVRKNDAFTHWLARVIRGLEGNEKHGVMMIVHHDSSMTFDIQPGLNGKAYEYSRAMTLELGKNNGQQKTAILLQ